MQTISIMNFLYSQLHSDIKSNSSDSILEISSRLKLIGSFLIGEKLSIKTLEIQQDSLLTWAQRRFNRENQDDTLNFLKSTINRALEIIQVYFTENRFSECKNLVSDLSEIFPGLMNIQNTYKHNRLFCCQIQSLIQAIQNRLQYIYETYPTIFPISQVKQPIVQVQQVLSPSQQVLSPIRNIPICDAPTGGMSPRIPDPFKTPIMKSNNEIHEEIYNEDFSLN